MKERYLTTEVAELISLSIGTVQKMVDEGEFKFFSTRGGHRRILLSSVKQYLKEREGELC
jgi:excisionase family DNA binding protein